MAAPQDSTTNAAMPALLHDQSDDWLVVVLGRDLQTATLRIGGFAIVACAVLALIAMLVR